MFFIVSSIAAFTVANKENIALIGECLDAGNKFDYDTWVCVDDATDANG